MIRIERPRDGEELVIKINGHPVPLPGPGQAVVFSENTTYQIRTEYIVKENNK